MKADPKQNGKLVGGSHRREAFSSTAQIAAAERLAEALVVGFGTCELEGRPLTELQKIDLLMTALAAFDGLQAELESQLRLQRALVEMGREESAPAGALRPRAAT